MSACVFCRKQTNNEYGYYTSDKYSSMRERVSVFVCTKCLRKRKAMIYSGISLFSLMMTIVAVVQKVSGTLSEEEGSVPYTMSVIFLVFAILATYNIYCIVKDKRMSDTYVARRLIKKANSVAPEKRYYTPAENALLTADGHRNAQSVMRVNDFFNAEGRNLLIEATYLVGDNGIVIRNHILNNGILNDTYFNLLKSLLEVKLAGASLTGKVLNKDFFDLYDKIKSCCSSAEKNTVADEDEDAVYLQAVPIARKRMDLLWLDPPKLAQVQQLVTQRGVVTVTMGDNSELRDHEITQEDITWAKQIELFVDKAFAAVQRKDPVESICYYKKALELAPGCDLFLMSIGGAYADLGQKKKALAYLERAAEISPGNSRIRDNLNTVKRM